MHIHAETTSTEHERQAYARNDDLHRTLAQNDTSTQALIFKIGRKVNDAPDSMGWETTFTH
ncbi:hypothetical protein DNHGIG_36030 [Collibacillus ludicampi]|uniref:Uncharacterized protein n=1 Tax=Collibacillus ludicampi TaxID=2771369 RepID=A0AAV4LKV3_9BACL|nr:hypothetical protein DNHGIG_36030 [Collibacillus ludicampi]